MCLIVMKMSHSCKKSEKRCFRRFAYKPNDVCLPRHMWHVSLTRTCVGAIQEHTVLTCFKHFSCDMKLHTERKKRERFSAGHRIMGHYFAKICGYSSFNKKTTCHSFSAVNIKPSASWCFSHLELTL